MAAMVAGEAAGEAVGEAVGEARAEGAGEAARAEVAGKRGPCHGVPLLAPVKSGQARVPPRRRGGRRRGASRAGQPGLGGGSAPARPAKGRRRLMPRRKACDVHGL